MKSLQNLIIFLSLVLFCSAFSENSVPINFSSNRMTKLDTVPVKDLGTINWNNVNTMVPLHGALIVEVGKEIFLIPERL